MFHNVVKIPLYETPTLQLVIIGRIDNVNINKFYELLYELYANQNNLKIKIKVKEVNP